MDSQIPWWVAAVSAIAGSFLMPLIDRITTFYKGSDEKAIALAKLTDDKASALAKIDDEKDQKFMLFLREELERSRHAEQTCQENYMEAMRKISHLTARCARLEAVMVHLHPEVADELLKAG